MRDDLPHAMRETARKLEPDVVRLTAGGVSRGTRMRRVERAVQVLGSAVAVALVFAGVALFGQQRTPGDGGRGGEVNQPAGPGAGTTETTSATGLPGTPNTPGDGFATATAPSSSSPSAISAYDLEGLLKTGLSGTGVVGRNYGATSSPLAVSAQLTDGTSDGFITIVISAPGAAAPGPGAPERLEDSSLAYVSEAPGTSDGHHPDKTDLVVTLVRPGGTGLTALETNAPSEKSAAAPGAPLLLQAKQIIAMLDSPVWDAAAAAAVLPNSALSPLG